MTETIVVTDYNYPDLSTEEAVLEGTDVELRGEQVQTPAEVIEAAAGADALLVQFAEITDEVFEALDLEAVGRYGIGVDTIDLDAATEHGVQVVNVPDYCVEEVPTHALALLLACAREITTYDAAIEDGTWDWTIGRPIDRVTGSTLGLVGFGKLPRRLVELVAGFDLEILAYDPYLDADEIEAGGAEKVGFGELLERSKYVSVHAPLTDETRGMIDDDAFAAMRSDAILVNAARGGVVDIDALERALEADEIAGAGLDVLPDEPPDPTPPIDHDDVVYTPHVAWYSEASIETLRRRITEDILTILRDEPPINPVNDLGNDPVDGPG